MPCWSGRVLDLLVCRATSATTPLSFRGLTLRHSHISCGRGPLSPHPLSPHRGCRPGTCSRDPMPVPSDDLATQGWDVCGGGDAIVARNRHALMPMGPGDKRRDDGWAYGAVEMTLAAIPRLDPAGSFIRRRSEEHTSELQSLMRIS